jgi:uncharacterized protein YecE (DUF72 family)
MLVHVGTSGFAYRAWVGPFYPEGLRDRELLGWYAGRLETVEINSTFYRFPTVEGLAAWAAQVPTSFRFCFKAPQRITHRKRLHDVEEDISGLFDVLGTLGARLGPVLFQLPPRLPLDLAALGDLLTCLPPGIRAAFEFRDARWHTETVFQLLADHGAALCFNDDLAPAPHPTTGWGYVRLRRPHYDEEALRAAAVQTEAQPWSDAWVFVKHEAPDSPLLAQQFNGLVRSL